MLKGGSAQKVSFAKLRRVVAFQGVIGPKRTLAETLDSAVQPVERDIRGDGNTQKPAK